MASSSPLSSPLSSPSSSTTKTISSSSFSRRKSAIANITSRRESLSSSSSSSLTGLSSASATAFEVDLKALVKIYFVDGSTKTFQLERNSTVQDALLLLKSNLDLMDISNFALYRVEDDDVATIRLCHYHERLRDLVDMISIPSPSPFSNSKPNNCNANAKLLFRCWMYIRGGVLEDEVLQVPYPTKQSTMGLWLVYTEAVTMVQEGSYFLSEDESLLLGCLRMQVDFGDYSATKVTTDMLRQRAITRFPPLITARFVALQSRRDTASENQFLSRIQIAYSRLAGKTKFEAQIDFIQHLYIWCPLFGAAMFPVTYQINIKPGRPRNEAEASRIESAAAGDQLNSGSPSTNISGKSRSVPSKIAKGLMRRMSFRSPASSNSKSSELLSPNPVTEIGGSAVLPGSTTVNTSSTTLAVTAAIARNAIFIVAQTSSTVVLRHPFGRILRWNSRPAENIFEYYVLRDSLVVDDVMASVSDAESSGVTFDPLSECDHVILISNRVPELDSAIRTSIAYAQDGTLPSLPGCIHEALMPLPMDYFNSATVSDGSPGGGNSPNPSSLRGSRWTQHAQSTSKQIESQASRIQPLLSALSTGSGNPSTAFPRPAKSSSGTGLGVILTESTGDYSEATNNSLTPSIFSKFLSGASRRFSLTSTPSSINLLEPVQVTGNITDINRLVDSSRFSDDESSDGEDESARVTAKPKAPVEVSAADDDSSVGNSEDNSPEEGSSHGHGSESSNDDAADKESANHSGPSPLRRASQYLFGVVN